MKERERERVTVIRRMKEREREWSNPLSTLLSKDIVSQSSPSVQSVFVNLLIHSSSSLSLSHFHSLTHSLCFFIIHSLSLPNNISLFHQFSLPLFEDKNMKGDRNMIDFLPSSLFLFSFFFFFFFYCLIIISYPKCYSVCVYSEFCSLFFEGKNVQCIDFFVWKKRDEIFFSFLTHSE